MLSEYGDVNFVLIQFSVQFNFTQIVLLTVDIVTKKIYLDR